VGRESIETALFLQGLAVDSRSAAGWGAAAGLFGLLALVLVVSKVGFRLPMKTLFSASTAVMVATAVMLLGKGLHGLQELGVLPLTPVRFFEIEFLGIFPDAWSLIPQLVLAFVCFAWLQRKPSAPRPETRGSPTTT
jgi:high-affinity iron transporter